MCIHSSQYTPTYCYGKVWSLSPAKLPILLYHPKIGGFPYREVGTPLFDRVEGYIPRKVLSSKLAENDRPNVVFRDFSGYFRRVLMFPHRKQKKKRLSGLASLNRLIDPRSYIQVGEGRWYNGCKNIYYHCNAWSCARVLTLINWIYLLQL